MTTVPSLDLSALAGDFSAVALSRLQCWQAKSMSQTVGLDVSCQKEDSNLSVSWNFFPAKYHIFSILLD